MGQKVNPVGYRLGVNRGWDSVWYAKKKDFGKFLIEDFKIREYIKKNVINSGVSKVMIERTSKKCFVTIYTSRPGFVIGKKGSDIEKIKNKLSGLISKLQKCSCDYIDCFTTDIEMINMFKEFYPLFRNDKLSAKKQNLKEGSYHHSSEIEKISELDLDKSYKLRNKTKVTIQII